MCTVPDIRWLKTDIDKDPVVLPMEVKKKCGHCGKYNVYHIDTMNIDRSVAIDLLTALESMVMNLKKRLEDERPPGL